MKDISTIVLRAGGILIAAFMLTPLLVLIVFAFSERSLLSFPITGLTLDWFVRLAEMREFWSSLKNSLVIAGTVGTASTVFGTLAVFGLMQLSASRATATMVLLMLPVMLPPLVLGIALLSFFSGLGIRFGLHTVILGHLVITQPFVILIVYARLSRLSPAFIESARDLGATPFAAFRTVVLPIMRPTIIGAAMITMALSLDDFLITFFTIGGDNTLPTMLWGMLRKGLDPRINAVALILISLTTTASIVAMRITRYRG